MAHEEEDRDVMARLPRDLSRAVRIAAKTERRNVNNMVAVLVEEALAARQLVDWEVPA